MPYVAEEEAPNEAFLELDAVIEERSDLPWRRPLVATPAFRVVPSSARPPEAGDDDLTEVKGIGPAYRARLAEAGITRFAELANAAPAMVAGVAGVPEDRASEWIAQARDLTG